MKQVPYWLDTLGKVPDRSAKPLSDRVDVLVIGGGLTGLSTALHTARKGAQVMLVEKDKIGAGASGRNGSMCNQGFTIGIGQARRRYGQERARELYDTYRRAVDLVEELVHDEGIDCGFRRHGRLGLTVKPDHVQHLRAKQQTLATEFGHDTTLLGRADLRDEVGSDQFHGGLLDPLSAGLHVGKFVYGMADAAERAGVEIHERNAATAVRRIGSGFEVQTMRGRVRANQVMVATDAYTDDTFPWFRRRLICVGSFVIVTEPLGDRAKEVIPNDRLLVDEKNVGHYIRLTPDGRLMFGGRARFAPSDPSSDRRSGQVLLREMIQMFPQLAGTRVEYVWGGSVGFSLDRVPHAGDHHGLYYSMGYCGHGVQMATYMGSRMAEVMDGHPEANPVRGLRFPAVPLYNGTAWFLPFAGAYYRAKDRLL